MFSQVDYDQWCDVGQMSPAMSPSASPKPPAVAERSRAAVQAALDLKLYGWAYVGDVLTGCVLPARRL